MFSKNSFNNESRVYKMWISPKIKKFVVKDGRENRHIFFNSVLKYSNNEKTDYNSYCGVTDESLNKLKWFESLESVRNAEIIFFFFSFSGFCDNDICDQK